MIKQPLAGVVFDLDNTLVSSSLNFTQIKAAVGCPLEVDVLSFIDQLPQKQQCLAKQVVNDYEMADAHHATKLAGADKVLALLSRLNIPYAIVTRNNKVAGSLKLKNNNLNVDLLLTREDFKAKPAPDALLYLAQHWSIPANQILCVGDFLYDILMANNAQTQSCLVSYGQTLEYANLATFVVDDLNALSDIIEQTHKPINITIKDTLTHHEQS
ncbi:HAD-IA family hydrolase [Colwellia sp. KU-HH00111]|uniref:HAD family hydrolase n=1 Tax=Colwellia sp. KU-HH00111 TaxID=3127652 RepID=UPI00310C3FAB